MSSAAISRAAVHDCVSSTRGAPTTRSSHPWHCLVKRPLPASCPAATASWMWVNSWPVRYGRLKGITCLQLIHRGRFGPVEVDDAAAEDRQRHQHPGEDAYQRDMTDAEHAPLVHLDDRTHRIQVGDEMQLRRQHFEQFRQRKDHRRHIVPELHEIADREL